MLRKLLIILLLIIAEKSFAQTDTEFWFAAPEVTHDDSSKHSDKPILLRITALNATATVTILQPANAAFISIVHTIAANTSWSLDLTTSKEQIESKPANIPINTGLLITSSAPITAYYEEASLANPEMFVLKGKNALGKNFLIPSQNIMNNWGFYTLPPVIPYSSFDIVATEDSTEIFITPAKNIVGHNAGITFLVKLNKGQVYSAAAVDRLGVNHLMGSIVKSNKKIAITIKDDSIGGDGYAGCLDLAGDQIVPVELVGTEYITLPGFLNNPLGKPSDHLFLMATENNTSITINGVFRKIINKGETYHDSSMQEVKYIVTSLPTYALHLTGFGCEVGHALLPPIECTGSQKVAFTRSDTIGFYMNILVPSGYENKFTFNGNSSIITANLFDTVPFSGGLWKYASVPLTNLQFPQGSAALVENSGIEFHLSIIHGDRNSGAIYGYFSDFNKLSVAATSNATNGIICEKDTLKFLTNYNNALAVNFKWALNDTIFSNLPNPILPNINVASSGIYTLKANKFSCKEVKVNLPIQVNPIPKPLLNSNSPICSGNILILNASYAGGSFKWTNQNGFVSSEAINTFINASLTDSGHYKIVTSAFGCSSIDSINVIIHQTPKAQIVINSNNVCLNTQIVLNNLVAANTDVLKWTVPNGNNILLNIVNIVNANFSDSGKYVLEVSNNFCSQKDSLIVKVKPIPIIQFPTIPAVCSNVAPFNLIANEKTGIRGVFSGNGVNNDGLFSPLVIGNSTTNITYSCVKDGCVSSKNQIITVYPSPSITLIPERNINVGGSVNLDAAVVGSYNSLVWADANNTLSDKNITNPIAKPTFETTYCLYVSTDKSCADTACVLVKIVNNIEIPNAFSPNGDNINDTWIVEDKTQTTFIKANIFDRYGKLVKSLFGNKIIWDGMYNGKPLPMATYYYVLNVSSGIDTKNIGGWIQLLK